MLLVGALASLGLSYTTEALATPPPARPRTAVWGVS